MSQTLDDDMTSLVTSPGHVSELEAGRITFGDAENLSTTLDFEEENASAIGDNVGAVIDKLQNTLLQVSLVYNHNETNLLMGAVLSSHWEC